MSKQVQGSSKNGPGVAIADYGTDIALHMHLECRRKPGDEGYVRQDGD